MAYQVSSNFIRAMQVKSDVCISGLQLAAFWPGGIMDTDGIKRAIHKAKDRRKALGVRRRVCISFAHCT